MLVEVGEASSDTATWFVNNLIALDRYTVFAHYCSNNQWSPVTDLIKINFRSFAEADYGDVNPSTFNLGSTFVHEAYHSYSGLKDEIDGKQVHGLDWTGPVVDFVNIIRAERNLPIRVDYVSEPKGRKYRTLRFKNVYPKKPERIKKVKTLLNPWR